MYADLLLKNHFWLLAMLKTVVYHFFRILWWRESSKEQHLSKIERCFNDTENCQDQHRNKLHFKIDSNGKQLFKTRSKTISQYFCFFAVIYRLFSKVWGTEKKRTLISKCSIFLVNLWNDVQLPNALLVTQYLILFSFSFVFLIRIWSHVSDWHLSNFQKR